MALIFVDSSRSLLVRYGIKRHMHCSIDDSCAVEERPHNLLDTSEVLGRQERKVRLDGGILCLDFIARFFLFIC